METMSGRKVLVLGSGGREHALADALLASPSVAEVVVAPGNAGTSARPAWVSGGKSLRCATGEGLELARRERPDLVVVGPEVPLTAGVIDELTREGFLAYGPSQRAAALEGSKAFMKDFAARHRLRTAHYAVVTEVEQVESRVREFEQPPVVKADGLCAGKGVVVAESHAEAITAAREMLGGHRFGAAGRRVVLEERLLGAEASVHAVCDGERAFVLPAAQDHKRIGDGDTGPNTGGMGTYAPAPLITAELAERIRVEVIERALAGMAADGNPFRGTLFAGLMISPAGEPHLLEFNVRFGDPETQVLMNVIDGDFAELLASAARGKLAPDAIQVAPRHALCVVLAAPGYPATPVLGAPIRGLERALELDGVRVYHAGTRSDGAHTVTAGGRVLGVTARGATLAEAHALAYRAAALIEFDGKQLRHDIGARALGPEVR
ncbi:MAG: phosphoribosylamine--glycine ligase [Myxococcales bacterium]|nr:phosphoribosylamine--glycine ligase [Myxococcales bacterium]